MVDFRNIPNDLLINALAAEFKKDKRIKAPEWTTYLKAGIHRESAWTQSDWYETRLASTLRKIGEYGPIGISRLSAYYGGRVDRGSIGYHPAKGSRFIVRHMLQTLESLGYVKKDKKGRFLSPAGISLLTKVSKDIITERSKESEVWAKLA